MAFEFMQSLMIEPDLDEENESDIELGDISDGEDSGDDDSSRSRPSSAGPSTANDDNDDNGGEWTDELHNVTDYLEPFTAFSGPIHDLSVDSDPLDYFKLFFPDSIIDLLVEETNRYAEQQQVAKGVRDQYWKPVCSEDIYRYIYTLITFGLHQIPETRLYWSSDPFWRVAAIADVWGRQRFQKVHQYFHVNNNTNQPCRQDPGFDPLFKLRPLLDHIRSTCSAVYKPGQNLSVDEAMIAFTGCISFRQYIKNKPTPWGFKVWCCAEADTGYLLNFRVYTGKQQVSSEKGQGYDVVKSMLEGHLGQHHTVYYDNFFSSVKLAEDLLKEKTNSCATIRPNRKGWPFPKDSKQKKGEVRIKQKGRLVAVQWTDKRQVNVLSTNSNPEMTTVTRRAKGGPVTTPIPAPVLSYNAGMFGVDLNDQHRAYYPVGRPGSKWWRYLFNYLVQISVVNSFILMKRARPDDNRYAVSQNHLQFRTHLVKSLIAPRNNSRRAPGAPTIAGQARPTSAEHTLCKLPGRKRRCYQCAQDGNKMPSGRTRETITGCPLCNIHLHGGTCFSKFHESIKH